MNDNLLKVSNLSKKFTLNSKYVNSPRLGDIIKSFFGIEFNSIRKTEDYWALKNISFELKRGENLGIVGLNGAGKSTLLKIILNRLSCDSGSFKLAGDAGGLIELGAGFHPEQTGRKNIYLNARLQGISKKEVNEKIDDIVGFSELEEFIDMPVKTYSSGMTIRLGFSVAIHFVKDLIICDEILAVGDFEFKQKCYKKIHELKERCSFILVSHSTRDIALFCDKAMFLHKGELVQYGPTDEVLKTYGLVTRSDSVSDLKKKMMNREIEIDLNQKRGKHINLIQAIQFQESEESRVERYGRIYEDSEYVKDVIVECSGKVIGDELVIENSKAFFLKITFTILKSVAHLRIGLPFFNEMGDMLIGPDSRKLTLGDSAFATRGKKSIVVSANRYPVNEGRFMIVLAINNDPGFLYRRHLCYVTVKNVDGSFGQVASNIVWKVAV